MKVLFSMRHMGSFRMYESVIRGLAARGHHVRIVVDRGERLGWRKGLEQLLADCPTVSWSWSVSLRRNVWFEFARAVRIWLDYLRYFDQRYAKTPKLFLRAEERVPRALVRLTRIWPLTTARGRAVLKRCLRAAEIALPRTPELDEFLQREAPDVVLLTPLVYLGSPQLEVLRSAKAQGLRTVLSIGSWDHLSSKALIRDQPQRIFVWNETQKTEAVELHGVAAERVIVTGAQCYDHWFGREPSRTREDFCRQLALPIDRPFVLYVCSALFWGSPLEPEFVETWVQSLRESEHDTLKKVGILIRPHPARLEEWQHIDLSKYDDVRLYGSNPVDSDSKNDYFDSLYYSAAVVGLNTSAFLEAAIVGRPVHTILAPKFFDNQEGTIHFHYLLNVAGGLLRAARSLGEHQAQLVKSVAERQDGRANEAFVQAFIRPRGLDVSATHLFLEQVEELVRLPRPAPQITPARFVALRVPLLPLALLARLTLGSDEEAIDRTSREIRRARMFEERARRRLEERQHALEARRRFEEARQREKAELLQQRVERHRRAVEAREGERRERERLVQQSAQRKTELKKQKEREKQRRLKRKRRGGLRQRIMQRLGLA